MRFVETHGGAARLHAPSPAREFTPDFDPHVTQALMHRVQRFVGDFAARAPEHATLQVAAPARGSQTKRHMLQLPLRGAGGLQGGTGDGAAALERALRAVFGAPACLARGPTGWTVEVPRRMPAGERLSLTPAPAPAGMGAPSPRRQGSVPPTSSRAAPPPAGTAPPLTTAAVAAVATLLLLLLFIALRPGADADA